MSGIIEVDNLTFGYTPQSTVVRDISIEVVPGTFLAIAGPNGAGKTTLLNLLCGALTPKAGTITIDAAPVESYGTKALAEKVAVVRQEFVPIFGFSVIEAVMMARTRHFGAAGFESKADREIVIEALELTDTAQFAHRPLVSLSGGERLRPCRGRVLAGANQKSLRGARLCGSNRAGKILHPFRQTCKGQTPNQQHAEEHLKTLTL